MFAADLLPSSPHEMSPDCGMHALLRVYLFCAWIDAHLHNPRALVQPDDLQDPATQRRSDRARMRLHMRVHAPAMMIFQPNEVLRSLNTGCH
jgi:hypothetical protein